MMVVEYTLEEQKAMQKEMWGTLGLPSSKEFLYDLHTFEGVVFTGWAPRESLLAIRDLETREDDIFVVTNPKSGTHWIWEITLLLLAQGRPEKIDRMKMYGTALELLFPPELKLPSHEIFAKMDSPRIMTTHLPWQCLPKQATEVSWGSWFDHVHTYWKNRNQENVFFASYEDLKLDFISVARPLSKFLLGEELDLPSLKRTEENASMKGMKKSYDNIEKQRTDGDQITKMMGIHSYIQKGEIGSWKDVFTVADNELFDEVCKEKMSGWELRPVYE